MEASGVAAVDQLGDNLLEGRVDRFLQRPSVMDQLLREVELVGEVDDPQIPRECRRPGQDHRRRERREGPRCRSSGPPPVLPCRPRHTQQRPRRDEPADRHSCDQPARCRRQRRDGRPGRPNDDHPGEPAGQHEHRRQAVAREAAHQQAASGARGDREQREHNPADYHRRIVSPVTASRGSVTGGGRRW